MLTTLGVPPPSHESPHCGAFELALVWNRGAEDHEAGLSFKSYQAGSN
jgi:hypothetical protein